MICVPMLCLFYVMDYDVYDVMHLYDYEMTPYVMMPYGCILYGL